MTRVLAPLAVAVPLLSAQFGWLSNDKFTPENRLAGIGVERERMSDSVLKSRSELMIESQTFAILRDPQALAGAARITSPALQKIFNEASRLSGLPSSFIAAVAYLESWGVSNAKSPSGPKGIMQIAGGTARSMGLRQIYRTKYAIRTQRKKVKGKWVRVRRKVPYRVLVRDERLIPAKAIPAAARYLARLESKFGGRDWAVFAYHCGEGCTAEVQAIARRARGMGDQFSVAKVFFGASPAHNRELYQSLRYHMERDYSPTYYFRITRAEQLLKLYKEDRAEFKRLYSLYRNQVDPTVRAPHRLSVWLRPEDLTFRTYEDLRRGRGKTLVSVFDDPKYYGFSLRVISDDPENRDLYLQASPSTVGTIAYIAYETRRLFDAMKAKKETWAPLEVTALVRPLDYEERLANDGVASKGEMPAHCTGHVFDISAVNLPPSQREALGFVLDELGWAGYLGFVTESSHSDVTHIGAAPTAREFFANVYREAAAAKAD